MLTRCKNSLVKTRLVEVCNRTLVVHAMWMLTAPAETPFVQLVPHGPFDPHRNGSSVLKLPNATPRATLVCLLYEPEPDKGNGSDLEGIKHKKEKPSCC